MKKTKSIIAIIICVLTIFSTMRIFVSAASISASLGYNEAESSGDYAYYKNGKMVKSSSTTKEEVKWMQAALNYCRVKEGLNIERLTIDGDFGPASRRATESFQKVVGLSVDGQFGPLTVKKMKSVLNDGKDNSLKPSNVTVIIRPTTSSQNTTATNNFKQQNILQVSASNSSKYISGNWYKYYKGNCSCCENKYTSEYGEHEYIQGGGCGIVSLVSAIYNLGGTISKDNIGKAINDILNWGYSTKTSAGVRYWQNGVKNRNLFNQSDEKFGNTYRFTISNEISGTSTDSKFVNHIKNGGTAVVHVYSHFMAVVDYKVENGKTYFLVFDPAPGSGTNWNSTKRKNVTKPEGSWVLQSDLKNDGGSKGSTGSWENIEIDSYWLVAKK